MARKLKKMILNRVDLVPAGANQDAHIVLFKAHEPLVTKQDGMPGMDDDANEPPPLTTNQILQQNQLWQQWQPLWSAFCESVWNIMDHDEDDAGYAPLLLQSIDEFSTQARVILATLGLVGKAAPLFAVCDELAKAGAVMAAGRKKRLQDAIAALQAILDEAAPKAADSATTQKGAARMAERGSVEAAELAAITKRAETAEARVNVLEADLVQKNLTPEQEEEAFLKSMPESFRKRWEADQALTKQALETATIEKDARQRQEYIEKTAAYRQVGITPDHHNILKAIDTLPEQERTELLRILKSADAVIKSSKLFVPAGSDGSGAGTSAGEQFMAQADALVKDKSAATIQEAMEMVNKSHPALYAEYQDEQRQKSRVK